MNNPFEYFTNIYEKTTDPKLTLEELLHNKDVYISCFFHAIVYAFIFVFIKHFVLSKQIDFNYMYRLTKVLFIFMIFGYIGRLYRIKAISKTTTSDDNLKLRRDIGYFRFYFLG
mgnify:CR=1 FL=1